MRKHFLLLFLLTLLPLVGWAVAVDPTGTPSLKGGQTYDAGNSIELTTGEFTMPADWPASGKVYYMVLPSSASAPTAGVGEWTEWTSSSAPTATDAGSYAVYYYTGAAGTYDQGAAKKLNDANVVIDKAAFTADAVGFMAPEAIPNVIFNGYAQKLFNDGTAPTDGTITYCLTASGSYVASDNDAVKVTNVVDAKKVYYKVTGCKNYYDSDVLSIDVTMAKATLTYTHPTAPTNLVYSSAAQQLIPTFSKPSLNGIQFAESEGLIQYQATGMAATEWSSNRGNAGLKKTNAGEYTVSWRVNPTKTNFVEATGSYTVTIAKAPLEVKHHDQAITYGETAKTAADFYDVPTTGWKNSENDAAKAEILAQALNVQGLPVVNAGKHPITLASTASSATDFEKGADNYYIESVDDPATYTINRKALYIKPENFAKTYDGQELNPQTDAEKFYTTDGWIANETDENKLAVGIKVTGITGKKDANTTGYDIALTATPTDASNYTPYISAGSAKLIINRKELTSAMINEIAGATYNGKAQQPSIEFADGNPSILTLEDLNITWDDETFKDAKTYTATINGIKNYTTTSPIQKTYVISPAINVLGGELSLAGWNYGENPNTPTGLTSTHGVVKYVYSDTQDGTYSEENAPTATKATGTYYVKGFVAADGNNYAAIYSAPLAYTIAAVALPENFGSDYTNTVTFDNADHKPVISVDAEIGGLKNNVDFTVAYSDESFKNQGTYIVTFTGKGNYAKKNGSEVNKVERTITINKKALADAMVNADLTSKTYNGSDLNPHLTLTDAEAAIVAGDYTVTVMKGEEAIANDAEWTEAGVYAYTIAATEAGNYTGSISGKSFTINPAAVSFEAPAALSLAYTGAEQALVTTPEVTGGKMFFIQSESEPAAEAEEWSENAPKGLNAKTYEKVWYKVVANSNYTGVGVTQIEVAPVINPVQLVYTLANKTVTYNKEAATTDNMYKLTSGALVNGETINQVAKILFTDGEKKNAGTYPVNDLKAEFLNDVENYDISFTGTATLTIEKYNITAEDLATVPAVAENLKFKKETAQSLLKTAGELNSEIGTILYATSEDATEWGETIEATDAASYDVWYKIVATDAENYTSKAAEKIGTVEIAKGGFASITGIPEENGVFNGENQPLTFVVTDENEAKLALGTDYNIFITRGETSVSVANAAGTYNYHFVGAGNYADAEEDLTWTIDKADITIAEGNEPTAISDLVYNGKAQPLISAGTASFGTLLYSTDGENWSEELPTGKDVGEYTVSYKVEGDDNHNAFAAEAMEAIAIAPAELTVTAPIAVKTYNGVAGIDETTTISSDLKIEGLYEEIAAPANAYSVENASANVGVYLTAVNADAFNTEAFKNYTVKETVKGSLDIKKAPAFKVTFAEGVAFEKNYGAADNFAIAAEDIEVSKSFIDDKDKILANIETVRAIEGEKVGTIKNAVALQAKESAAFTNYEGFTVSGTADLTIKKNAQKLQISIAAQSKDYDGQPAVATKSLDKIVLSGDLLNGDTKESLLGANVENLTVTINGGEDAIDAGTYSMTLSGDFQNYDVTFVASDFTINQVELTASVEEQTTATGALVSNIDNTKYAVTGFIAGEENLENNFQVVVADEFQADGKITATETQDKGLELIAKNEALLKNYTGWNVTGKLVVVDAATIVLTPYNKAAYTADNNVGKAQEAALKIANGKIANISFGAFTMNPGHWYTLVLPFNTSVIELSSKFGYAVVEKMVDASAGSVKFAIDGGDIIANEPFLIQIFGAAKDMSTITFESKPIVYSANPQVEDNNGSRLVGTYTGILGYDDTFVKNKQWYMATSDGKWYSSATGYTRPTGAFLDIANAGSAPIIYIEDPENGATAIMSIGVDESANVQGWYTVNGMKLDKAPVEKGVYVKDGKKVVIK